MTVSLLGVFKQDQSYHNANENIHSKDIHIFVDILLESMYYLLNWEYEYFECSMKVDNKLEFNFNQFLLNLKV